MSIGVIVEGHGETAAVPIVIRRVLALHDPAATLAIPAPLRLSRGKLVKPEELGRAVELMARKAGDRAPVVIFLDGDDAAPRSSARGYSASRAPRAQIAASAS